MKNPLLQSIILTIVEVIGAVMILIGSIEVAATKDTNPAYVLIPIGSFLVALGAILHSKWKPIERILNKNRKP